MTENPWIRIVLSFFAGLFFSILILAPMALYFKWKEKRENRQKLGHCKDCRFWAKNIAHEDGIGVCRRHAPVPHYYVTPKQPAAPWEFWAVSHKESWCGEFEKKER